MNLTVETRHMAHTDALKEYAETKASKLTKFFDNIQRIEVILDTEAGEALTEILIHASPKPINAIQICTPVSTSVSIRCLNSCGDTRKNFVTTTEIVSYESV